MDVKEKYSIVVGSTVFFEGMEDFVPGDTDRIVVTDNPIGDFIEMRVKIGNTDNIVIWEGTTKDQLLEYDKTSDPISCGKWLVPEVCEHYGVGLSELNDKIGDRFDEIDERHRYEKYIWDCYCENGRMELDKKQIETAYGMYKLNRMH